MAGSNVAGMFDHLTHAKSNTTQPQPEPAETAAPAVPKKAAKTAPKKAPSSVPVEEPAPVPAPTPKKAAGKKNDPDWEGSFVFLRIDTKADAIRLLKRKRMGQDFSELCEMLLAEWVERNS